MSDAYNKITIFEYHFLFALNLGEQQKIKDLWQQQQDQLQQQYDHVREEEEQQRHALEQLHEEHPYNLITGKLLGSDPIDSIERVDF